MSVHDDNARVFKALCDPKRLAILDMLRSGETCVCYLMESLDMGQSAVSYHMKILCDSGIVSGRQDGKWTYYSISEAGSRAAVELLELLTDKSEASAACACSASKTCGVSRWDCS